MPTKTQSIGICDHCLGQLATPYTSKGKPRRYCSVTCRNTANSRAGRAERSRKARLRIADGTWRNPAHIRPPTSDEQADRARKGRKREVEAGTWRNPALSPEAREKLSRPRKHSGALADAIEKLGAGIRVADLTPEEQDVYRAYRRRLDAARRDEINANARERYRRKQETMSDAEREAQREKWRRGNRRRRI